MLPVIRAGLTSLAKGSLAFSCFLTIIDSEIFHRIQIRSAVTLSEKAGPMVVGSVYASDLDPDCDTDRNCLAISTALAPCIC